MEGTGETQGSLRGRLNARRERGNKNSEWKVVRRKWGRVASERGRDLRVGDDDVGRAGDLAAGLAKVRKVGEGLKQEKA